MVPGLVAIDDSATRFAPFFGPMPWVERPGVRGRYVAGEELTPGRLVVLVGDALFHATLPLVKVVGVVLLPPSYGVVKVGYYARLARRAVVSVDLEGNAGNDTDAVYVLDGGKFAASGGELVERARFLGGAVEINL